MCASHSTPGRETLLAWSSPKLDDALSLSTEGDISPTCIVLRCVVECQAALCRVALSGPLLDLAVPPLPLTSYASSFPFLPLR